MISTNDLYWTAGFLDGEGWFGPGSGWKSNRTSLQVAAPQKHPQLLYRLKAMFGGEIYDQEQSLKPFRIYMWRLSGASAVGLMMTLYPLMSDKRKTEIVRALTKWRAVKRPFSAYRVWKTPRTHCVRGHEANEKNTYYWEKAKSNKVGCRICAAENQRKYLERRRLKLVSGG